MNSVKLWLNKLIAVVCIANSVTHHAWAALSIDPSRETLAQLYDAGLVQDQQPIRLHLGCGQAYISGYINIDFPSTEHTVQAYSVADAHADITQLNFPAHSIDVIESHHIFEHFDRQTALALLCAWHTWLKPGGILIIETPDFEASIAVMMSPKVPYKQKQVSLRHIFGSHEAHWAYHYDGWYKTKFEHVLGSLGFFRITCQALRHNPLIPSILVQAQKMNNLPIDTLKQASKAILRDSMVDEGDASMWSVWCQAFDKAMSKLHI